LFHVNKLKAFAHYANVRTDSNERDREGLKMAKAAAKRKPVAKKKPAKRVSTKRRTAKRTAKRRR
jgi:hypothetical protein